MSWRDSGAGGAGGGGWAGGRPSFDNPMSWSVPLLRAAAIDVRVHVLFLVFALIWFGQGALSSSPRSLVLVLFDIVLLFAIVLLHEFGHCFGCRAVGGRADEILMWPLGGLAYCAPPHRWTAHLVTVVAGPAVNVVICVILIPLLAAVSGRWLGTAIPNFLGTGWLGPTLRDGSQPWWLLVLYMTNVVSLVLLLFNLLPVFPLDGGRIVQALLWPRVGYERSMRYAVYTGYVGAIAFGIFAAIIGSMLLFTIAVFGGITCHRTLKQLEFTQAELGPEDEYGLFSGAAVREDRTAARAEVKEAKRREREAEAAQRHQVEVDRILAKIAESGMGSLTAAEKRTLRQETDRSRGG